MYDSDRFEELVIIKTIYTSTNKFKESCQPRFWKLWYCQTAYRLNLQRTFIAHLCDMFHQFQLVGMIIQFDKSCNSPRSRSKGF